MMGILRTLLACAICSLGLGCAAPPEVSSLQKATSPRIVNLEADASYKFSGAFGKEAEVHLLPGTYRLEKENASGQFYLGDLHSVWWMLGSDLALLRGGVWMPTDSSKSPRIYFYYGYQEIRAKTLADALSQRRELATKGSPVRDGSIDAATAVALQSAPPTMSPLQAGVGAGIAAGLVGALADFDSPVLYQPPTNEQFKTVIDGVFRAPQP
ncbi:hypothetical protein [Variovorax sp. PAMC26660]|uniref:hypothetical protein n=1 Tax=Variovorax sp. PAMC26660 TaxID=2762322 RepID=UPI00164DFE59|nr:hypothetical protein [Variovorax sp. PAMC26660]QNK66992.1 hypothetical protein H7F35_28100 [Variovorax sp. PAMC26660]